MGLKEWKKLPACMRVKAVRPYYDILQKKKAELVLKRLFDVVMSAILLMLLLPVFIVLSILIAIDSKGGVFYRQERVTQYGRIFRILKFRTMTAEADKAGPKVTAEHDKRITRIGGVLRKYRLDELPQLFNIIAGDMSFVGTRPEVPEYVKRYTPQMRATLLLPAGVTSEASIQYKDEGQLLREAKNIEDIYIHRILPEKMEYNLKSIEEFSILKEIKTLIRTALAVMK